MQERTCVRRIVYFSARKVPKAWGVAMRPTPPSARGARHANLRTYASLRAGPFGFHKKTSLRRQPQIVI